jgi:hypothetical protein
MGLHVAEGPQRRQLRMPGDSRILAKDHPDTKSRIIMLNFASP